MKTNENENLVRMMNEKNVQNWTKLDARKSVKSLTNEKISIDSFSLYIPEERCSYIAEEITREIYILKVDSKNGDIISEEYKTTKTSDNTVKVERKGYSIFFQYVQKPTFKDGKSATAKYVRMNINSKFLEEHYLTGINRDTIDIILNRINETGLIKIDKASLLKCVASDIDFKRDAYVECTKQDVGEWMNAAYKCVKAEYKNNNDKTVARNNIITGTGSRENRKVPFFKYYNKLTELVYNSSDFNDAHLNLHDGRKEQIVRCELTVVSRDVAVKLGLISRKEYLTLEKLMFLTDNQSELLRTFEAVTEERYNPITMDENKENKTPELKVCKLSQKDAEVIYTLVFENIFTFGGSEAYAHLIGQQIGKGSERKQNEAKDVVNRAIADAKNAIITRENSINEVVKETNLFTIFRHSI